ncbi:MAG: EAL domain-containing protein [Pseudomonadota bacterium]
MKNVLLVDDEKSILSALKRSLRNQPFNIFTAQSAQEAYDILDENPIQVMLTDYKMPRENGAELIANVSSRHPSTVSMLLSGQADYEKVVDLMSDEKALKFIKKPWAEDSVINAINDAFAHYHKTTNTSWHQKANAMSPSMEQHEFECSLVHSIESKKRMAVCMLQMSNLSDLFEVLGEEGCLSVQCGLISNTQRYLSTECISHCYAPGLVAFAFPVADHESLKTLLTWVRAQVIFDAQRSHHDVNADIRIVYRVIQKETSKINLVLEELKRTVQSTSPLEPILVINREFSEQLARDRLIRSTIRTQLNEGRFSFDIQPKVSVSSGLIENAEILLRWHHSTLGWLPPDEFIRLAEIDGQINELGNWVLSNGIALAANLLKEHTLLKSISINVSSKQLYEIDFINNLLDATLKAEIAPGQIELEITETCIAQDVDYVVPLLQEIKRLGFSISIDDFGAGETAFNYLADLPLDILKLDRCLTNNMLTSDKKQILVRKLVECCHDMDFKVVAEGIEDSETLQMLKAFHCDQIQGFVYSKAVSPSDFRELLSEQPFEIMHEQ